ncbi:hypothetical protein STCU_05330 [Strigomonas culicis]|uniref:Uncharacterized protein n=1 Tax=Strigomonas culicis TaxID=28005 RepID=S9UB77_9TRYP|nr:hypothetical protein STCU_05330 [Strigomonas culicis]|eukprot:EPY28042.1 hypothetical protein STCU_05330 [Strigomonas culicis]
MAVKDAWDAIGVPADQYWSHKSSAPPAATPWSSYVQQAAKAVQARHLLVPDPRSLLPTFYPTRLEAIASRGYATNRGALVVGLDKPHGNSSKVFNVLSRDTAAVDGVHAERGSLPTVAAFVAGIAHPFERNLYVMIDEDAPVDPFFDIDFSYAVSSGADGGDEALPFPSLKERVVVPPAEIEEALAEVLLLLAQELQDGLQQPVERCLVLTSSAQVGRGAAPDGRAPLVELKVSFHVHFRLRGNAVLHSIKDLQQLVGRVRARLAGERPAPAGPPRAALLFERLVDSGVYSRWRAFRLPYNVKSPISPSYTFADAATDDLLCDQLAATGIALPDPAVGAVAPTLVAHIELSHDAAVRQRQTALLQKLFFHFRFLLPVVPGVTRLTSETLIQFLAAHPFSTPLPQDAAARAVAVMDMASVQRDDAPSCPLRRIRAGDDGAQTHPPETSSGPFSVPVPPRPTSVRVPVYDMHVKGLLAEVFACLSPAYAAPAPGPRTFANFDSMPGASGGSSGIRPEHLYVQYEEGIRAYYVIQKQNKYCLRQHRCHKSTYAQLYLTYGSIKVRCFSNDCCDRCLAVPWEEGARPAEGAHVAGYPQYARLTAIRDVLFPPLSPEELVRRYGAAALTEGPVPAEVCKE